MQFFNGQEWISTLVSGSYDPVTISGGTVTFWNLSVDKNVISRDNSGTADVLYISTNMTSTNKLITLSDVPLHATMVQGQSNAAALYASNAQNGAILEGATNQITISGGSGSLTDHIVLGLDGSVIANLALASNALQGVIIGNTEITKDGNNKVTIPNFGAASDQAAGTAGLVPAPAQGDQNKFLCADGTWHAQTSANDGKLNVNNTQMWSANSSSNISLLDGTHVNLTSDTTTSSVTIDLNTTAANMLTGAVQGVQVNGTDLAKDTTTKKVNIPLASHTALGSTSGDVTGVIAGMDGYDGTITSGVISINTKTATSSTNQIATESDVTSAIEGLDVTTTVETVTTTAVSGGAGTVVTLKGVKESDGLVEQGTGTNSFTVGNGALKLSGYGATEPASGNDHASIPTVSATDVFSANDTADSTIALGNEFVLDATNKTIGLRVKTAVSATNAIATELDIASISGAMHYKGSIASDSDWPSGTTEAGDTYVITGNFTHSTTVLESGDMVVFNGNGGYTVVQTNMTIGVADGQIAKNDGALTATNIVIATANGISTNGYTIDAESTTGTTTISDQSTNTKIPTSENVYDFVSGYVTTNAVQTVTEATSVSTSNNVATVTDSLTVDSGTPTTNSFSIGAGAGSGINVTSNDNAITIAHTNTITAGSVGTSTAYSPSTQGSGTYVPTVAYDANGHITSQNTTATEVTASNIHATYNGTTSTDSDTSVQNVLDSIDQRVDALEGATSGATHKMVVVNPALTLTDDVCTWTISNTLGTSDCVATVKCNNNSDTWASNMGLVTGEAIECRIVYTSNNTITIEINSSTSIEANALKCVVVG